MIVLDDDLKRKSNSNSSSLVPIDSKSSRIGEYNTLVTIAKIKEIE